MKIQRGKDDERKEQGQSQEGGMEEANGKRGMAGGDGIGRRQK